MLSQNMLIFKDRLAFEDVNPIVTLIRHVFDFFDHFIA